MNDSVLGKCPALAKKLAKILGEVGKVAKTGHNSFHNYDYVTENDLVYAVRGKLAENNIFIFTSVESQSVQFVTDPEKGKQSVLTCVETLHTLVDGDTGESFSVRSQGQGSDVGDKGGYKAITGAMKYFLYKSFLIPTGDDPEGDGETDKRVASGVGAKAGGQAKSPPVVPALPAGVDWEDVKVHFGNNKGIRLGDMEDDVLLWYRDKWSPKFQSPDNEKLRAAINAWDSEASARR